ncbi:MAG TPA: DNA polymerase III subunit delta [Pirellulaceae bacterium]|nr:DNA polymerase III subunit delta [Pirellulaceae bacterium]
MLNTLHVFEFLSQADTMPAAVTVLFGDEPFLKRLALKQLVARLLGDDDDTPYTTFRGTAEWRDVADELSTVSLFGGNRPRLAIVEEADPFVTRQRGQLETYVAKPKSNGILVLEVSTWAANTRLYKAVNKTGLQIECRAPQRAAGKSKVLDEKQLCTWLTRWAKTQHDVKLESHAASSLLEVVGPELGLLDQELAKLALFAGSGGKITTEMVADVVGGWRAKTTWDLVDAAAEGDAGEALRQLERLLYSGEHPVALFGQIAWSLRRLAAATRIYQNAERSRRKMPLRDALIQAGIQHWNRKGLEKAEKQLIQLGRHRAGQLYRWLLEADLALKGSHSTTHRARFVLERLILRMAKASSLR